MELLPSVVQGFDCVLGRGDLRAGLQQKRGMNARERQPQEWLIKQMFLPTFLFPFLFQEELLNVSGTEGTFDRGFGLA